MSTSSTTSKEARWQRALVTGASSGIGEGFARLLAAEGSDLVLVARRKERLERLARELRERHGVSVEVCVADLTDPDQLQSVADLLANSVRHVDLLINNAGDHKGIAPFIELDINSLEKDAMINGLAVLRLTHAAASVMKNRGRGNIINLSSGVSFYPAPGQATYAATKAFVNNLSEAVNHELRGTGVRVTTICPGFTRTDLPTRLGYEEGKIPRMLWMNPEDVARKGLNAASRGTSLYSPGLMNRMGAWWGTHLPRWIVLRWVSTFFTPSR